MKKSYIFVSISGTAHLLEDDFGNIIVDEKHNEWYFSTRPYQRYKIGEAVEDVGSFIGLYIDDRTFPGLYLDHLSIIPEKYQSVLFVSDEDIIPQTIIEQLNSIASRRGVTTAWLLDDFLESIGYYGDDDDPLD